MEITFEGITFDQSHVSVEALNFFYSQISKFQPKSLFNVEIVKRSFSINDPGIVKFHGTCHKGRSFEKFLEKNPETFKKISIHLFSSNVSSSLSKMIFSYLKRDLETFCQHFSFDYSNFKSKNASGLHVLLSAETSQGTIKFIEKFINEESPPWEDICRKYVISFTKLLMQSGAIQTEFVNMMLVLMGSISNELSSITIDKSFSKQL